MEKEKQIEEMAQVIEQALIKANDTTNSMNYGFGGWYAKELYTEGYRKIPKNIGEFSDGYHTFNELYHHRAILFSVICNSMPDKAWKSKLHDTGDMYEGMFIVGIETPEGQATYHYDIEPYWDIFKVKELEKAPKWDGHTPQDAIDRIAKISADVVEVRHGRWIEHTVKPDWLEDDVEVFYNCSECGSSHWSIFPPYCPNCGAKMDGERKEDEP